VIPIDPLDPSLPLPDTAVEETDALSQSILLMEVANAALRADRDAIAQTLTDVTTLPGPDAQFSSYGKAQGMDPWTLDDRDSDV
jgi:hypothetical protein